MSNMVRLELVLKGGACTDDALAFENPEDAGDAVWIPRSQIQNLEEVMDEFPDGIRWGVTGKVEIEIPTWLVEEKGLDSYAEEVDDDNLG